MDEVISDRELVRRIGKGERPRVVKLGEDRWKVLDRIKDQSHGD